MPLPEEQAGEQAGDGDRRAAAEEILRDSEGRVASAAEAQAPGDAADEHRRSEEAAARTDGGLMSAWICVRCAMQYPDTEHRPPPARSARTSGRRWPKAASAGRPRPRWPPTTARSCGRRSPACSASASSRRSRSANARCSCARPHGNVLWDCVPLIDEPARRTIEELGGISADLPVAPALLRRVRRLRRRVRRPGVPAAGRRAVDPAAARPGSSCSTTRWSRARRHRRARRRPLRRRCGAALGRRVGRGGHVADGRHDHGGGGPRAGSASCGATPTSSRSTPTPWRNRAAGGALPVRHAVRRLVGPRGGSTRGRPCSARRAATSNGCGAPRPDAGRRPRGPGSRGGRAGPRRRRPPRRAEPTRGARRRRRCGAPGW